MTRRIFYPAHPYKSARTCPRTFFRKNNCFTNALSCVFAFAAFQTSVRTTYILRFKTLPLRIVAPRAGKGTPFHKYSRPNPRAVVSRKLFNRKYFSRQSDSSLSSSLTRPITHCQKPSAISRRLIYSSAAEFVQNTSIKIYLIKAASFCYACCAMYSAMLSSSVTNVYSEKVTVPVA